jgi:HD-like signal output (HDOD) protein
MQKVCGDEAMFALGSSIARVVQMASSDDHGTHDLANYVLSDAPLTQRVLRLSNTARYRTASGANVTTVTRAISLLGFDNVKAAALAMLLVDALSSSAHAQSVRAELQAALCASLVGRQLARHSYHQGAEEASIAALFKNLGAVLVASHEHDRYREISQLSAGGKHTLNQASQLILGSSYDALTEAVLGEWNIPDVIVRAVAAPPAGSLKPALNRGEWMRQVASFGAEVARLLARPGTTADSREGRALLERYGAALTLDQEALATLFANVREEMSALLESLNMKAQPEATGSPAASGGGAGGLDELPDVLLLATLDAGDVDEFACHPSGKPLNARDQLLAGVQEVTQMRAAGQCKVNDVILAVLETLYNSMGFRFATVCLKDPRTHQFRARISVGEEQARRQAGFAYTPGAQRDLFTLAMENNADLMIADAGTQKIRDLLPTWYRALLPDAKSFIVLPLVVGKAQLGFFYADRALTAPEGVPPDETSLIKALKNQVLAALS